MIDVHSLCFDYTGLDRSEINRLGSIWLRTLASMGHDCRNIVLHEG